MAELSSEELKDFENLIYEENQYNSSQTLNKASVQNFEKQSSNNDNQQYLIESPFRASDPTIINRHKIIGFEKTGQLLRKIKRELSSQALQKCSQKNGSRINDKLSTQHSNFNLKSRELPLLNWQNCQRDQLTQAMIDEYQKQILRLKAQLDDIKEEKRQIKQTLQKQRKFFMSEMYSKQLIAQQNQFKMEKLKGQIQKHINLQYQFQQKIRLLELQNSQFKYQLDSWISSQHQNSTEMEPIYEENEEICNNSTKVSRNKYSNKMFMSLDNGFANRNSFKDEDPFQMIRLAHQREILQYQKEIKNLKQFYQNRIKLIRKSHTPQKGGKPRNSISIMDEYICGDTLSCQSQSYTRPQNLRSMIKEQMHVNSKQCSSKKVDNDCESMFTIRNFTYPNNSKKTLNDIESQQFEEGQIKSQNSILKIKSQKVQQEQNKQVSVIKKLKNLLSPSKQFIRGFAFGGLSSGLLAIIIANKISLYHKN